MPSILTTMYLLSSSWVLNLSLLMETSLKATVKLGHNQGQRTVTQGVDTG